MSDAPQPTPKQSICVVRVAHAVPRGDGDSYSSSSSSSLWSSLLSGRRSSSTAAVTARARALYELGLGCVLVLGFLLDLRADVGTIVSPHVILECSSRLFAADVPVVASGRRDDKVAAKKTGWKLTKFGGFK